MELLTEKYLGFQKCEYEKEKESLKSMIRSIVTHCDSDRKIKVIRLCDNKRSFNIDEVMKYIYKNPNINTIHEQEKSMLINH